jgi:hypothetical protein
MRPIRLALLGLAGVAAMQVCQASDSAAINCEEDPGTDPRFALIAAKLPIANGSKVTVQMLLDETRASEEERKQIADFVDGNTVCADGELRKKHWPPEVYAAARENNEKYLVVLADLYGRKLTYGDANRQLKANGSELVNKVAAIVQRIKTEHEAQSVAATQQKAAEIERARQDAEAPAQRDRQAQVQEAAEARALAQRSVQAQEAAALAQMQGAWAQDDLAQQMRMQMQMQPLQLLQPFRPMGLPRPLSMPQPPVRTNCTRFGNYVSCSSQ